MRSKLFYLTLTIVIIVTECYSPHDSARSSQLRLQRSYTKLHAEVTGIDDVKTVDIFSLDTIRSTLVRQGEMKVRDERECYAIVIMVIISIIVIAMILTIASILNLRSASLVWLYVVHYDDKIITPLSLLPFLSRIL
jgi:hypothetical protein